MFKSFPFRIYLIALVLRLIPVLLTRGLGIGLDDMFQYDMLARSLAQGYGFRWYAQEDLDRFTAALEAVNVPVPRFDLSSLDDYDPRLGIPTSFRAPLYPFFLSIIYLFSGAGSGRFFAARMIQAGLTALLAPLTFYTAQKFLGRASASAGDPDTVAVVSAWVVAIYPMLIAFPLALATENLFIILIMASFLMALKTWEKPVAVNLVLTGILLGLSAMTRSVVLIACGLVIVWFYFALKGQRLKTLWMVLSMSLVILPWVARNSVLHHRIAGIETSLGYQLYLGYHPESDGTFKFGASLDLIPIMEDGIRDRVGTEKAIEFIRQDPARFIPLAFSRLGYFFGLERRGLQYFYSNNLFGHIPQPWLLFLAAVTLLPFVVLSISGALGLALIRRSPQSELLILLMTGYLFPHVFILSEERFHLVLVPFITILAAHFWTNGFEALSARWRDSSGGRTLVLIAVLGVLLLLANWGLELHRDWDKIAQLLGPKGNRTYFPY